MEPVVFNVKKYFLYAISGIALLVIYTWITSPLIVSVTGVGELSAKAETASLTFTLSANADSPQKASLNIKESITRVKETLKTSGIPESDIYESQVALYPASALVSGASGFTATVSMGIKTTQVNNLDGLTNDLYGLGASIVTQPVLSVGNIESLEKDAYNMAVKDAKRKAGNIALKNFKFFRKAVLIEQSATQPTSTVTQKADTVAQVEKNLSPDDGLIKISKVVSVSYKMW